MDIMRLVKERKLEEMKNVALEKKNKKGKLNKFFGLKKK